MVNVINLRASRGLAIIAFASLGGMLYGYDLGVISGALIFIKRDIYMSLNQESFLIGAVFTGSSFATVISGFLADYFGRKRLIIASTVIFSLSIIMIAFAHTYLQLITGRLIQGASVGIITIVVPLYLTEAMPASMRGRGVTTFQLLLTLGIFFSSGIGLYYSHSGNWQAMFLVALIPSNIMTIGCFFLTESPRWVAMKGDFAKVLSILKKTRSAIDAKKEMLEIKRFIRREELRSYHRGYLWQRKYVTSLLLVFSIAVLQQLTGMNLILQLTTTILAHAGLNSYVHTMLDTNVITGLNVLVTIIAVFVADKFERRTLMSFGTGGIVISMLYCSLISYYLSPSLIKANLLLYGLLSFVVFYAIGPGALVWVVLAELLPLKIRGNALGMALFLNSITSSVFSDVFFSLAMHIHYAGVFGMCGSFTCLYFIISLFFIPKTRGKSLEDIEAGFDVDVAPSSK